MKFHKLLVLLLLASAPVAALPAERYSLQQAIGHALEHNPELLALREQANAAVERRTAAAGAQRPQLGLSLSARTSNNALDAFADKLNTRSATSADFDPARLNDPGYSELFMGQLGLRWPVYTGGRLSAEAEGATHNAEATKLHYARAREVTAFGTLRAYRQLQQAEQALAIADDAVAAAAAHARTTEALSREGRIVTSDKLTADVNLAAMEAARAQARARVERARNSLRLVMGLSNATPFAVDALRNETAPRPFAEYDLSALETTALATRKDLAATQAQRAAADTKIQAARAARRPQIDVVATHNRYANSDSADHSNSLMGVLALDLYSGGRTGAEVAAAAAEAKQAEWETHARELAIRNDVREAVEALREAHARHVIATGNVERARQTVGQVQVRYGQGRTILIDLLQAERALVEARSEELNARFGIVVGEAALAFVQGTLPLPETTKP